MAYSINPNLPHARAIALRLLIVDNLPALVVANRCGIHRTTLWRWKKKWDIRNINIGQEKAGRPTRQTRFVAQYYYWSIPTNSSRPHTSPRAIAAHIVQRIMELRYSLKRCAEVVWHHLVTVDGISVSLSSVRRILKRHHQFDGARKKRVRPDNPGRPQPTHPGELVQADTIHYVDPTTKRRRYVYTVIDLYSRMAYAEIDEHIRPGNAATVVLRAEGYFGFKLSMIQTDNGLEFSGYFEDILARRGILARHSRLGRPNDNAHIERFNRTIQEECLGRYLDNRQSIKHIQDRINKYLEFYNAKRVHLGLQFKTPLQMLQSS
jgi:transposase InsO family protein